jgi:trk system potassium uptake protein TrkA
VLGICGSGAAADVLMRAGVSGCEVFIATAESDEINILSCVIAKKLGAKRCIARVRDPSLSTQMNFMSRELGLSLMVNPEYYASREISRLLRMPSAIETDSFAHGRIDLVKIKVAQGSVLDGLKLRDMPSTVKSRVLVCAVQPDKGTDPIIPDGDYTLHAGDKVHFTASHAGMSSFLKEIGMISHKIKNVMIIGGGRVSYYLARLLCESGMSVKILEHDKARCIELAKMLPKATIINADGTNQELLSEQGLGSADACIALTGVDEDNTIISLYATLCGVFKVITKINKPQLRSMAESVGLESIVSPKQITAETITSYVRAQREDSKSQLRTLYKLVDGSVEAMEFIAQAESRVVGKTLAELKLKSNLLIAGIFRAGKVVFPRGSDKIEAGDFVIVVTKGLHISSLDEILM